MRGRRVVPANCEMLDGILADRLFALHDVFLGEPLKRGEESSDMNASRHHDSEGIVL